MKCSTGPQEHACAAASSEEARKADFFAFGRISGSVLVDAEPHAPTGAVRDHEGGCWPSRALCTSAARVLRAPLSRSWRPTSRAPCLSRAISSRGDLGRDRFELREMFGRYSYSHTDPRGVRSSRWRCLQSPGSLRSGERRPNGRVACRPRLNATEQQGTRSGSP